MQFPLTLIDLAGSVALLLWGVHMVQTGILRAFGPDLRRLLGTALRRRLTAFASGLGVTAILQSSTATGLMVAGFCAAGVVDLVPALAAMLGANVGTTLIVQVFSFHVVAAAPVLIVLGVGLFRRGQSARNRDLGRVSIGLGLMLLALQQLLSLVTPYEDAPSLRMMLGAVTTEPLLALLIAAGLTWAAHSSVAMVLLVMSLAAQGVVPPETAFALVLGANLGTAINPVLEGARGDDPVARRVTIGNLLTRAAGCVIALVLLGRIGPLMVQIEPDTARVVADFHTGFNLVLAAVFLPVLGPYAALLRRLLPARVDPEDPATPRYLDNAAIETPPIALAAAAREALRMADTLEAMLNGAADALTSGDRGRIAEVRRLDDVVDKLNRAIRTYITALDADSLSEADHRRLSEILIFTANLESAGDVVDRNLMSNAARRLKRGFPFPEPERAEAARLLGRLASTVRAAAAVFMTEDARAARQLVAEKEVFRDMEAAATSAHFAGLRNGGGAGAEAGVLHLDLLRDMKRVNGHLVAAAAYPVLENQGELLRSRLRPPE
ncbi:MAG TPA: Na/Pi cotransporter family protein [Acetobacteraceae bacterium]|nr:Na/Pi cotransporter family protein [Acetobacteraceae bacterium]